MPGLICDVCGLPTVPFGGEDVCLSRDHRDGYEDGDGPERDNPTEGRGDGVGQVSSNNGCPNDVNDFERGYDQAVQEVLDEVCERDPDMAEAIAKKYPVWARICANRKYGHT